MEVRIIYTIDYAVMDSDQMDDLKVHCDEYNIKFEKTSIGGVYRFLGSNESNIRDVQKKFSLKEI